MDRPRHQLSKDLLNNLFEIERLYGALEKTKAPKSLLLNLEEENLVQSTFSSTSIEGNPLSKAQVTNILLAGKVPSNRNEKEVQNYFEILKDLSVYAERTIDIELIKEFHRRLLKGVDDPIAGKLRNIATVVGSYAYDEDGQSSLVIKHNPPYHKRDEIESALRDLLEWLQNAEVQPIIKAGIFHHQFQFLHPFEDGNGRVGRLLTALILVKLNYRVDKYFVLDDYYDIDRTEYSDSLHSADYADETKWLIYFTNGVKYSLQSAQAKIEEGLKFLNVEMRPTKKEQEVLEYFTKSGQATAQEIADYFDVSRQQAHKFLSSLIEKGYLKKVGGTKGSYYILL